MDIPYRDKMIRLWSRGDDGRFEECEISPLEGHRYSVNQVEFSPNGEWIVSCSLDGLTLLWDVEVFNVSLIIHLEFKGINQ